MRGRRKLSDTFKVSDGSRAAYLLIGSPFCAHAPIPPVMLYASAKPNSRIMSSVLPLRFPERQ